jgi:regulator of sirC expression with transglutaminase-like and TPR domain
VEPTLRAADLDALVRLLGDENPRIYEACRRRLLALGARAASALADAESFEDPRVRVRARSLLDDLRFDGLEAEALELVRRSEGGIDLERGAFLLARAVLPAFDPRPCAGSLVELSTQARSALGNLRDPLARARGFGRILGVERGLRVDDAERHGVRAGLLPTVLERRAGTSIAVCLLYLAVARRVGLPLRPVALPAGLWLRGASPYPPLLLDPARSGRVLDREDLEEAVETAPPPPRGHDPLLELTDRGLLARSAAQLAFALRRAGGRRRAQRLGRLHGIFRTGAAAGPRRTGGGTPTTGG